jgi:hypothetical protein
VVLFRTCPSVDASGRIVKWCGMSGSSERLIEVFSCGDACAVGRAISARLLDQEAV